jgi:hypothetical protein
MVTHKNNETLYRAYIYTGHVCTMEFEILSDWPIAEIYAHVGKLYPDATHVLISSAPVDSEPVPLSTDGRYMS